MIKTLTEAQKAKAIKDLKILNGVPPYDGGGNICLGDGYFAKSIKTYGMTLEELSKACGFDKIYEEWKTQRESFLQKK